MIYPQWSDLGTSKVGNITNFSWQDQMSRWEKCRTYFEGDVFEERMETQSNEEGEPPLMYPVGMNLVRMMCLAQADTVFGEWSDDIFKFKISGDGDVDDASKAAIDLLVRILQFSKGNSMFWEAALDREAYGGAAIKISVDLKEAPHIRWTKIPLGNFFPIWDPDNEDELLEVYVVTQMTADQARERYSLETTKDVVARTEHWTRSSYENFLDDKRIDAFSGTNPWGFIPFTYIPRFRTANWYGEALTDELIPVQDEMNGVVADIGEAISYNAHPIRWGINMPRSFDAKNFPIGANAFWDLGRTLGSSPKPEVGILQANKPIPQEAFDYVHFIYDWSRTSSFAPAVVFGEDQGGAQRSGTTVELRMWSLIKYTRRSRAYMGDGIIRLIKMTGKILKQKGFTGVSTRAISKMIDGSIIPSFSTVLPPDHQAIVDEVVKLSMTEPKQISVETAQDILGRGAGEVNRIKTMLKDETFCPPPLEKIGPAPDQGKAKMSDNTKGEAGKAMPQGETHAS